MGVQDGRWDSERRGYAEIAADPAPSLNRKWKERSEMEVECKGRERSPEQSPKTYVLPPLDSKYDLALGRHYALKYPPSSPIDSHNDYSKEWFDGNSTVQSQWPQAQLRLKTPNCPWGVDRKRFRPADQVLSTIRLETSRPFQERAMGGSVRSHSSLDEYPPRKGMIPSVAFERMGKVGPKVIPGYTGHFTGFRDTVGKTYGHAELLLGRMSPACLPMYRKEDVVHDEMGICRSGYPTFVKYHERWSRRPDTAARPLVKDPVFREAGRDVMKHLSNMLIERVHGKASWPIQKALFDLRRAATRCSAAVQLMTQAEVRALFLCMKVEMHERDIQTLFDVICLPTDNGMMRIEVLCDALEKKQHEHPLSSPSKANTKNRSFIQVGTTSSRPPATQGTFFGVASGDLG